MSGYTKETIFSESARLFSEKSYHVVTIREIAAAVHINEASIYNHYESKAEILDTILTTFERRLRRCLLTKEQVDACLETNTPRRVLMRCIPDFGGEEEAEFMRQAFCITYMEQFTNVRADKLVRNLLQSQTEETMRYLLDQLRGLGQIPAYDTAYLAVLWSRFLFTTWLRQTHRPEEAPEDIHALAGRFADMVLEGRLPSLPDKGTSRDAPDASGCPEPVSPGRKKEVPVLMRIFNEEAERLCTPEVKARILKRVHERLAAESGNPPVLADEKRER